MPQAPTTKDVAIYQLKVTLKGSKPPIWRWIQVESGLRLGQLHAVLQCAMGWTDSHLHQFIHQGRYYGEPSDDDGSPMTDEDKVKLSGLLRRAKSKFVYEYDFGDGWMHDVVVEKILPKEEGVQYPRCMDGERACPPEDCGGVWGFYNMLEAVADPKHPDHTDLKDWLGGGFDPEAFTVEAVNADLAHVVAEPRAGRRIG